MSTVTGAGTVVGSLLPRIELRVCNSGGGGALDAEQYLRALLPGDEEGGLDGLGLSIVDAVCRLYGLRVGYSYINRCHCFSVHFPDIKNGKNGSGPIISTSISALGRNFAL